MKLAFSRLAEGVWRAVVNDISYLGNLARALRNPCPIGQEDIMNHLRNIVILGTLAFASLGISGCLLFEVEVEDIPPVTYTVEDDACITCDRFDDYLASCDPSCAADWDCVWYYDRLDYDTQLLLDDCADCLAAESWSCNDCIVGAAYCTDLLTTYLGMNCAW